MIGAFLRLVTVLAAFAVVLSATMLYRVKTETRLMKNEIAALERESRAAQRRIDALETEWAYLNSPGYLSNLVSIHTDALDLVERVPDNFANLSEIPPRGALAYGEGE
ncbi:hypothetical protein [uncultured Tateyamaria sp.]|uniref:cell division protein FtsL n=1 Tax=uncultured Tateyamaria sp. TaxID=455651 RepID=UPI00260AA3B7|nr:hypothetical protein [uncultured Tateyamaria sp.]